MPGGPAAPSSRRTRPPPVARPALPTRVRTARGPRARSGVWTPADPRRSGENLCHYAGRAAVGQPLCLAAVVVHELVVIQPEQVQERRLEVVRRDDVLG